MLYYNSVITWATIINHHKISTNPARHSSKTNAGWDILAAWVTEAERKQCALFHTAIHRILFQVTVCNVYAGFEFKKQTGYLQIQLQKT